MLNPGIISFKLIMLLAEVKTSESIIRRPDSVEDIIYTEAVNFTVSITFDWLTQIDWTEDQMKECQAVMHMHKTERYAKYSDYFWNGLPKCTVELAKNASSRRAIIHFGHAEMIPSCLASIQFLIRDKVLDMIASFRSWDIGEFAQYDLCVLEAMALEAQRHFNVESLGKLYVNVGSAHIYLPA
jgi:thymidylate synthase